MSAPAISSMNRIKPGMCPHGMPAGSCPICNGMGGGGGAPKRADVRKAGEMSWSECFAMGQRMKADKLQQQQAIEARQSLQATLLQAQSKLADAVTKMERMADMVTKNLPEPANKLSALITKIALPVLKIAQKLLNVVQNITSNIAQFVNNLKERFEGIQDKLAAIFGEFKNSKDKTISDRLKTARKKIFSLLFGEIDEELKELEEIEAKDREMDLKTVKDSLLDLRKYEKEVEDELCTAV